MTFTWRSFCFSISIDLFFVITFSKNWCICESKWGYMISWKYALRSSSGQSLPIYERLLSISITSFNCFFSFLNSLTFYSHLFTASQYTYIIFKWLLYLQSVLYFVLYVVSYLTCFMSCLALLPQTSCALWNLLPQMSCFMCFFALHTLLIAFCSLCSCIHPISLAWNVLCLMCFWLCSYLSFFQPDHHNIKEDGCFCISDKNL